MHNFLIATNQNIYCSKTLLIEENTETGEIQNGSDITPNLFTPLKKTPIRTITLEAKNGRNKCSSYFWREGQVPWQVNMI